ncbi:hypothetical protein F442_04006 [Phytophthora nicotianae P10297]|uniref:PiggyBac transposable element-derived protein domain-containing protein n=1 Tax=Phytophthora nicotianae P10297 TaxID=1317064 RepID=W2ZUQ3_PHYNI|nr:hypothetical protein F442_04006 [Phytophthora nicotianae P10297]
MPLQFAPCTGYVVFKDKKVVIFYTNDLADTPTLRFQGPDNEEAIRVLHGLQPLNRWIGNEMMHRSVLKVPSSIVAYNIYMKSLDRVGQKLSTNRSQRKEKRLSMTMFTCALDLCPGMTMREFKRRVVEELTSRERSRREKKRSGEIPAAVSSPRVIVNATSDHHITTNKRGRDLECRLCRELGLQVKVRYGCTGCKEGFHVDFFTAYYARDALNKDDPDMLKVQETLAEKSIGQPVHKTRVRSNNSITPLPELKLHCHRRSGSA